MSGTVSKARFVAPRSKAVAKTGRSEWFSVFRDEERQVRRWGGFEGCCKIRVKRYVYVDSASVLVFRLRISNPASPSVLPSKPDNILSSSRRVEQERQCKVGLGSERMVRFELCDLLCRP
jgi:hypothetical protein